MNVCLSPGTCRSQARQGRPLVLPCTGKFGQKATFPVHRNVFKDANQYFL